MTGPRDIVAEAEHHSTACMASAVDCLAYGRAEPSLAPVMTGCAFICAGLGMAIASVGVFTLLWQAAQADADLEISASS